MFSVWSPRPPEWSRIRAGGWHSYTSWSLKRLKVFSKSWKYCYLYQTNPTFVTWPRAYLWVSSGQRNNCAKCNEYRLFKSPKAWDEYNISEDHIKQLIILCGFCTACCKPNEKVLACAVTSATHPTKHVLYNAHKHSDGHRRRKSELLRLIAVVADTRSIGT